MNEKYIEIAKYAAIEAGKIQMSYFGKDKRIEHKGSEFDLVTNADKEVEEKVFSIIKEHFPDHDFLGEEEIGQSRVKSDYLWVVDPIDGTTNYAHNFPHFAVSIALYLKDKPLVGVVLDPFKNEMFWAQSEKGAFLNENPISVSNIETLNKSLLATGFPAIRENGSKKNLEYFERFLKIVQAIRRPGAASLDLCYVACGRLDGFWELGLSPWDVAAGVLIIKEAGGNVTNIDSDDYNFYKKDIIATNGKIHQYIKNTICAN